MFVEEVRQPVTPSVLLTQQIEIPEYLDLRVFADFARFVLWHNPSSRSLAMGYTTDFEGEFTITPTLKPEHAAYLRAFSETRRMKRNEHKTGYMEDPIRKSVGLPVGREAEYYVGAREDFGQGHSDDIIDYNRPPVTQPGLWCKWEPNEEGTTIRWSGAEKFYDYVKWLQYLIDNFLAPWGYVLEGVVEYQGEDPGDFGRIRVDGGDTVVQTAGRRVY